MVQEIEELNQHEINKRDARNEYENMPLDKLVEKMAELEELKEQVDIKSKKINAYYDVLRLEKIPAKMEEGGIERITYEGIGRVSLTADLNLSVKAGMKENIYEWMRENNLGDLIQETINASTLKAWYKARIKKGEKTPDDLLNVNPFVRASITKK
jgi:hypothetical protein